MCMWEERRCRRWPNEGGREILEYLYVKHCQVEVKKEYF